MSPQEYGISTTYKTRVATEKPCKERLGIVIGQLKDRRGWKLVNFVLALQSSRSFIQLKRPRETQAFLAGIVPAVIGLGLSTAILLASGTLHSWRTFIFAGLAVLVLMRWKVHTAFVLAVSAIAGSAAILP